MALPVKSMADLNILPAFAALSRGGSRKNFLQDALKPQTSPREIFSALAILCQGYLVAHANSDGTPACEADDPAFRPAWEALKKTGWVDFCATNEANRFWRDLTRQRDQVTQLAWWRQVLIHDQANLRQLTLEIGSAVAELVIAVFDDNAGKISLGLVANAYLELAQWLEVK